MKLSLFAWMIWCAAGLIGSITLCLFDSVAEAQVHSKPLFNSEACDTIVVCPDAFQSSLAEWLDHRKRQGHEIAVISPALTARATQVKIRELAVSGQLRHVFLVGDVHATVADAANIVPTHYVPAVVNVLFGSEAEIATDTPYGDLDDDGVPDVAVGRFSADSAEEVKTYLQRVIRYELDNSGDQSWRRKVNFVAGMGGFGQVVDSVLEQTTKQILTDLIPAHYETSMTFGSWRSPFCPDPRRFSETAIERFNAGCMFWVYLGHGHPTGLEKVHMPDQAHSILDTESVNQVRCRSGSPIAIFLSCYTGAFDHRDDCLAEEMLRQPCGPIAAICGTRVTMPYAMSLMSLEMLDEFFDGEAQTLGELLTVSKQRMVLQPVADERPEPEEYRAMIEGMGKLLSPRPDLLKAERLEHAQMMQLLGDPLLRLKRPDRVAVSSVDVSPADGELTVTGLAPMDGELTVELVYRRDRFRERPLRRKAFLPADLELASYQAEYIRAHDLLCDRQQQQVVAGSFSIKLKVPENAEGACAVRCLLDGEHCFALGSKSIEIGSTAAGRQAKQVLAEELR